MNTKLFKLFVAAQFIGLICLINQATTIYGETTGASFLKIGIGARPISMGSAFSAISNDVSAIHYNPAGLSQLTKRELLAMHSEWIADTKLDFIGFAIPLAKFPNRTIGGSVIYLSQSEIEGRDESRQRTGNFAASDLAITISYSNVIARNVSELSLGTSLKFIRQQIESEQATGVAIDIGLLYKPNHLITKYHFNFGFSIQNLVPQMKFIDKPYNLPLTIVGAIAYRIAGVNLAFDVKHQVYENKTGIGFGTEYIPMNILSLRLG
ncbi:MAG: PorV/PorQ family protein, partial [Elusimicrobiota bacterium]|nr:PorV/PorQ family protein [Elusimicrobiota bacterium]